MKLLKLFFKYLKFCIVAKNKHDIHSPFLYNLTTKVINKKLPKNLTYDIEKVRKRFCRSKLEINIVDFGAGSIINKSNKRKIKDIAKNSSKNSKFGNLLFKIISFYEPKIIIELGTSLGISTLYLAKANTDAKIFTFEGCPETAMIAKKNFNEQKIKNISLTLGDFDKTLKEKLKQIGKIDFAFIDGNHTEEATIKYFEECLKYSHNDSIFVIDDIHWSPGMENAWNYIKNHKKTTLTVNLFFVGIVFLKSELSKENIKIRF